MVIVIISTMELKSITLEIIFWHFNLTLELLKGKKVLISSGSMYQQTFPIITLSAWSLIKTESTVYEMSNPRYTTYFMYSIASAVDIKGTRLQAK